MLVYTGRPSIQGGSSCGRRTSPACLVFTSVIGISAFLPLFVVYAISVLAESQPTKRAHEVIKQLVIFTMSGNR
jgi:hypothetical protein